jgi:uncharacterized membrane protein YfcA
MIVISYSMIRQRKPIKTDLTPKNFKTQKLVLIGALTGALTGLIGIGGGFLIVPALVFLAQLEMKKAIATSLLIITLKSAIGFIGDLQAGLRMEWEFLFVFSSLAIIGIFIGQWLITKLSGAKLKRVFGFFALTIAIIILVKELI